MDKLHEAEEKKRKRDLKEGGGPADDKGMKVPGLKDRSLFDRLSKERMLRE